MTIKPVYHRNKIMARSWDFRRAGRSASEALKMAWQEAKALYQPQDPKVVSLRNQIIAHESKSRLSQDDYATIAAMRAQVLAAQAEQLTFNAAA